MKEFSEAEKKFIEDNKDKILAALMLQAKRYTNIPIIELVNHIKAQQKVKDKLPIWYNNPEVRYPAILSVEQSSSEKTAKLMRFWKRRSM